MTRARRHPPPRIRAYARAPSRTCDGAASATRRMRTSAGRFLLASEESETRVGCRRARSALRASGGRPGVPGGPWGRGVLVVPGSAPAKPLNRDTRTGGWLREVGTSLQPPCTPDAVSRVHPPPNSQSSPYPFDLPAQRSKLTGKLDFRSLLITAIIIALWNTN